MDRVLLVVVLLFVWGALTALQGENGQTVTTCRLDASAHEEEGGYYACVSASGTERIAFSVHPKGIPADVLRLLKGSDVEIVLRKKTPRNFQEMVR